MNEWLRLERVELNAGITIHGTAIAGGWHLGMKDGAGVELPWVVEGNPQTMVLKVTHSVTSRVEFLAASYVRKFAYVAPVEAQRVDEGMESIPTPALVGRPTKPKRGAK